MTTMKPCETCGKPVAERGLDQKDTAKGHTLDNVVPCCKRCNAVKMDHFSYEQMLRLSVTIREIDREKIDCGLVACEIALISEPRD